jgi:hypothetical protein
MPDDSQTLPPPPAGPTEPAPPPAACCPQCDGFGYVYEHVRSATAYDDGIDSVACRYCLDGRAR